MRQRERRWTYTASWLVILGVVAVAGVMLVTLFCGPPR